MCRSRGACSPRSRSRPTEPLSGDFLDLHAVPIEGESSSDLIHCRIRLLIAPRRIFGTPAVHLEREVAGVALVWAMRAMRGSLERAHVGVLTRDVEHRLIAC